MAGEVYIADELQEGAEERHVGRQLGDKDGCSSSSWVNHVVSLSAILKLRRAWVMPEGVPSHSKFRWSASLTLAS